MSCKVSFALLMDSSDVLCFLRGLVGQGIPSGASPEFLSMIVWLVGDCSLDCHLHLLPSFPLLRSHLPRRQRPTTYIPGKSFEKSTVTRYVILYPNVKRQNTIKSTLAVTVQVTTWPERMQKSAYDVHVMIYHLHNTTRP